MKNPVFYATFLRIWSWGLGYGAGGVSRESMIFSQKKIPVGSFTVFVQINTKLEENRPIKVRAPGNLSKTMWFNFVSQNTTFSKKDPILDIF